MSSHKIDTGTDELLCKSTNVVTITLTAQKSATPCQTTHPALRQTLLDLESRSDVGCIVITGAGTAFCAGGDVGGMGGTDPIQMRQSPPHNSGLENSYITKTLTLRLADHNNPHCRCRAGLSIALACDIRIAAASAFITTAFRNIGFWDYGGSWLLTQLVGPARARTFTTLPVACNPKRLYK